MNSLRSYGSIILVIALFVIGQVLILPLSVSATSSMPPTVPAPIEVPAGSVLLFSRHAGGQQIYECLNGQWAFHAPRALLSDPESDQRNGIHYGGIDHGLTPGPWWESLSDGSRIRAGNPVSAPSPNPNSIPLLRLQVLERQGAGEFSAVSYIQRLNTVGGTGPTGACEAGAQQKVLYRADYYFYATP